MSEKKTVTRRYPPITRRSNRKISTVGVGIGNKMNLLTGSERVTGMPYQLRVNPPREPAHSMNYLRFYL